MTGHDPDDGETGRGHATLTGTAISRGFGAGPAWIVSDPFASASLGRRIDRQEIAAEWERIRTAFDETRVELEEAARRVEEQFSAALAGIFRAHTIMLDGILASGDIQRELETLVDAERAVRGVFRRWHQKFRALPAPAFQQRADDVADLARRILRRLAGRDGSSLDHVPGGSVLVLARLLPSDVIAVSRRGVAAIVVEALAPGSHAALLAREKRIPVVAGMPGIVVRLQPGEELLVDGARGVVVVAPDAEERTAFESRRATYELVSVRCRSVCHEPAFTLDRERVTVEANLGAYDDVAVAVENGADGVGLFRIEQLYLARALPPTEEELLEELRTVTAALGRAPITVRLLDIGGDKPVPFLPLPAEANPSLGKRGVRLLLEYPELARAQLRALLRLSAERDVRILVPMITLEEDIHAMRALFDGAADALAIAKRPPFGAMIETPAAALSVPAIARHVDFLCVGTNDLTQYTLAAGRDDPAVTGYYIDTHAAVLRLLAIVRADADQMPVTVCGELAGREELIPDLLRMGFRALSMAPELIPPAKQVIRGVRLATPAAG